jgi:hypothetical protein
MCYFVVAAKVKIFSRRVNLCFVKIGGVASHGGWWQYHLFRFYEVSFFFFFLGRAPSQKDSAGRGRVLAATR